MMTFDAEKQYFMDSLQAIDKKHNRAGAAGGEDTEKLLARKEVPEAMTWDLRPLFVNDEAWEECFQQVDAYIEAVEPFRDNLTSSAKNLLSFGRMIEKQGRELTRLASYASMKSDEDTGLSYYSGMVTRVRSFMEKYAAAVSFANPAIAALSEEAMEAFYKEEPELEYYRRYCTQIRASKPHILSLQEESLLAGAKTIFETGARVFSVLNNADQRFPAIQDEKGNEVELTHARYGGFMESKERSVRKAAYEGYYAVYEQFRNTYAATLASQVHKNNYLAKVRNFTSAREAALFENEIPELVYDQLLATVNNNLDLLHRYVVLRKKLLGLEEIHSYDLHVPLGENVELHYSIEEARDVLLEALKPLGEDYCRVLEEAFAKRWIDFAENIGKRSGAYSGGCYDSPPYILMTWKGRLNNLYTLAHELGHSVHSYLSRKKQGFAYARYPIFLAEIASTVNENLLTAYLLESLEDKAVRQEIILNYLDGFKGTVFRQSQFAEFEQIIHKAEQEGMPLTADWLTEVYGDINAKYYGEELVRTPQIAFEWARIPHFYYNFYVYQYSTGFSAASAFAKSIIEGGEKDLEAYLGFLASGSKEEPIATLKRAGLDMTSPKPIEDAMSRFERFLEILEKGEV